MGTSVEVMGTMEMGWLEGPWSKGLGCVPSRI